MIYVVTGNTELFDHEDPEIKFADVKECLFYLENKEFIGLDTETEGFDCHSKAVLSLQLGDYDNQYVIDTSTISMSHFKGLLERKDKTILMQNAKFDLKFLYKQGIIPSKIYDTFLAEMVLWMGYPPGSVKMGLDALAYKYCGAKLDKGIRGQIHWRGLDTTVIKYGSDDVKYLERIKDEQELLLREKDLTKAALLDMQFVRVLAYIEYCGLYLNKSMWEDKMRKDNTILSESRQKLDSYIIENNITKYINPQLDLFNPDRTCSINWASSDQVIPLMKSLGVNTLTIDKKTGQYKDSVESKVLQGQKDKSPLIPLYLTYKQAEKVVSTYGKNWIKQINPITGRIHSNFRQLLNTGRMSCGGKDKSNRVEFVNLQNIPSDHTRTCFTNQYENTILINSDFSGQEAVIFANKCLDRNLLKFYDEGLGDQHSYVASLCFPNELSGVKLEDIKKVRPDLRQKAKAAGFAIQFGGQGITIAQNLNISDEEGEEVYNAYFRAFPDIDIFFKQSKESTLKQGYVYFNDITNRKSFIDFFSKYKEEERAITKEFWEKYRFHKQNNTQEFANYYEPKIRDFFKMKGEIERRALNYQVQGSAADCTKVAGIYFFQWILDNNLFNKVLISNVVHDEFLLEVPKNIAEITAKALETSMEKAGAVFCKRVPLRAEAVITNHWEH